MRVLRFCLFLIVVTVVVLPQAAYDGIKELWKEAGGP